MISVEIRQMRPAEIGRVVEILAHWNMAPVAQGPDCPDPETTGLEEGRTFVAIAGDTIVGVASYVLRGEGWAETASLAVDPAWRGQGIGERLQRSRLAAMQALGVRHVRTETDRPETIAWYQRKFGYHAAGIVPKKHAFSLVGVSHWTVLVLDIDNPAQRSIC
jgi:ribosomal protein S18 acetylase RimI-like enzyme